MVHNPRYGPTLYIFLSLYGKNDYSNYEKPTELGLALFSHKPCPSLFNLELQICPFPPCPSTSLGSPFIFPWIVRPCGLGAPSLCTPTQTILLPKWFLVFHSIPFYPILSYSRIPWNIPTFHGGSCFPLAFAQTCPTYPGTLLRVW